MALVMPRRFFLRRTHDVSGVSGCGVVAFGVQYPDGRCATRWNGAIAQTCSWDSVEDIERIHGHDGATTIVWIDPADQILLAVATPSASETPQ